jgi:hypothetical protein
VPGGGELGGVGAEFGDDGRGVDGADPGDLVQPAGQPGQQDAQVLAAGGVAAAGQAAGRADRGGARDGRQVLLDLLIQQSREVGILAEQNERDLGQRYTARASQVFIWTELRHRPCTGPAGPPLHKRASQYTVQLDGVRST